MTGRRSPSSTCCVAAPPSRLISQIGPTGDDYFGPGARDTEYMEPGSSHKRTAAVSVSY